MSPAEQRLRGELDEAHTRILFLERAIAGTVPDVPTQLGLTKGEAQILCVLMANKVAPMIRITTLAEISEKSLVVFVNRMRPKLAKHGITIKNCRGVGYYLTEEDKAKVRAL